MEVSESLINRLSKYSVYVPDDLTRVPVDTMEESLDRALDTVDQWFRVTEAIMAEERPENDINVREFRSRGEKPFNGVDPNRFLIRKIKSGQNILRTLIEIETVKQTKSKRNCRGQVKIKSPKIFISHKKEDKPYADALVNLINFIIGPAGDKIFCSSIPGYGIRQSRDIIGELKAQFDNHDVFMVIIHSPRYYRSIVCLNEMGASWVLGTKFSSFMTKDCTYEMLQGVIGKDNICININDEVGILNAHLNDFKDDLLSFFSADSIDENKWEHARDRFVKEVSSLTHEPIESALPRSSSKQEQETIISDKETAIIKKWAGSNSIEAHIVCTKDGTSFILGPDSYDVNGARELMEWNDFFDRLQRKGFIRFDRTNRQGNKVYRLMKPAFDYIDTLS